MPVLKSGLFVPLYLLEKEWWKRGTQSLTYVILRPGCLLFDHNCKRGFRMSFNSRSSFFFFPYLPCPLSLLSTRGAQLFIHSWLGNLVPPRRQCRERHTGLWERKGPQPLANYFPEPTGSVPTLFHLSTWGRLCDGTRHRYVKISV